MRLEIKVKGQDVNLTQIWVEGYFKTLDLPLRALNCDISFENSQVPNLLYDIQSYVNLLFKILPYVNNNLVFFIFTRKPTAENKDAASDSSKVSNTYYSSSINIL